MLSINNTQHSVKQNPVKQVIIKPWPYWRLKMNNIINIISDNYHLLMVKFINCNQLLWMMIGCVTVRSNSNQLLHARLCAACGVLDDEYHFVLVCERHGDVRRRLISKYYYVRPNMLKYVQLVSNVSPSIINKLARYVKECFIEREWVYNMYVEYSQFVPYIYL